MKTAQGTRRDLAACFACSRVSLGASRVRVSQCGLKTSGATMWMVHVASSRRLRGVEAENGRADVLGCIRLFYPNFVVFIVLVPKGILVI
jgi:hypothetical protein